MEHEYEIKTELLENTTPKQFNKDGRFYYYVRLYIQASPSALDAVEFVKYKLHPSFKDRFRISQNRARNFEVKLWTYGYFDVEASLVMKDGSTGSKSGYVQWKIPDGMPFTDDS